MKGLDAADSKKARRLLRELLARAMNNENAEPFVKLPSRRLYLDYYLLIKNPVSLQLLKAVIPKLKELKGVKSVIKLIASNCAQYNEPHSDIVQMSEQLVQEILEDWDELGLEALLKRQEYNLATGNIRGVRLPSPDPTPSEFEVQGAALEAQPQPPPEPRVLDLQDFAEYEAYIEEYDPEEQVKLFCDLMDRVFRPIHKLSEEGYEKVLVYLWESDLVCNIDVEMKTFEVRHEHVGEEDLRKLNKLIQELI